MGDFVKFVCYMGKKSVSAISAFSVNGRIILLLSFFISSFFIVISVQGQVRVGGVVRDANGASINGASVNVKGTAIGTTTDSLGRYEISVPGPNAVLVFSSVGFAAAEQTVGNRKSINISLVSK